MSSLNAENVIPLSENIETTVAVIVKNVEPSNVESEPSTEQVKTEESVSENVTSPEEEEAQDAIDEDEDQSYVDDSDEDMDEDEEDEAADQFGEQSEEVVTLMSFEEEARAAAQLAESYGLNSTDDALALVGKGNDRRMGNVINNYSQHFEKEPEVAPFYDAISVQINSLRSQIDSTIVKVVGELSFKINESGVEIVRTQMELFMRELLRYSGTLAEYCNRDMIATEDILQALITMNRPMYWNSAKDTAPVVQQDDAVEDAEEEDDDVMDEDEEDDGTWKKEQESTSNEDEERGLYFAKDSFRSAVDVVKPKEVSEEGYEVVQAATENYLIPLIEASARSTKFVGKNEIGGEEVRFALQMISRQ